MRFFITTITLASGRNTKEDFDEMAKFKAAGGHNFIQVLLK
jgi:hypothetical protein